MHLGGGRLAVGWSQVGTTMESIFKEENMLRKIYMTAVGRQQLSRGDH